jgi:AraC-like DNA-binding protein
MAVACHRRKSCYTVVSDKVINFTTLNIGGAMISRSSTRIKARVPGTGPTLCQTSRKRPDQLLEDLARYPSREIGVWADGNGLARETVSRGFLAAYGTAPSIVHAELRARSAWLRIIRGSDCLCRIAMETGFADQAHMTRWVHRITGAPPAAWRRNASVVRPASCCPPRAKAARES